MKFFSDNKERLHCNVSVSPTFQAGYSNVVHELVNRAKLKSKFINIIDQKSKSYIVLQLSMNHEYWTDLSVQTAIIELMSTFSNFLTQIFF